MNKIGLLEQGCQCEHCSNITKQNLLDARVRWQRGQRDIVFKPYDHTCGDGCCRTCGTNVFVNGFEITSDGENAESVVESLMEFLEIDSVTIDYEYEDKDL